MQFHLFDLPLNLTVDLLKRWLSYKDIAVLDAAECNRSTRAAYLETYKVDYFTWDVPSFEVTKPSVRKWIVDREVKVTDVSIGFRSDPSPELMPSFLTHVGPTVLDRSIGDVDNAFVPICRSAINTCVRLKVLSLNAYTDDTEEAGAVICSLIAKRAPTLERLAYEYCDMDNILPRSCEISKLKYLAISECTPDTATLCSFLSRCPHLVYFHCTALKGDDVLYALARSCPSLASLHYGYHHELGEPNAPPSRIDGLIAVLQACKELTTLDLSSWRGGFSNEHIAVIARHCKKLIALQFSSFDMLGEVAVAILTQRLPALRHLAVNGMDVTSDTAFQLLTQHCRQLRSLGLTSVSGRVTDAALVRLFSALPYLEELDFVNVTWLTDAVLVAIGKDCANLRTLDLTEASGFTEKGIAALAKGCPALECIYLESHGGLFNRSMQCVWQVLRPKI